MIEYRLKLHGMPVGWQTGSTSGSPAAVRRQQLSGPYRLWHHTHTFEPHGEGTLMRDIVRYALRCGRSARWRMPLVRRDLERIFDFRRDSVGALLALTSTALDPASSYDASESKVTA